MLKFFVACLVLIFFFKNSSIHCGFHPLRLVRAVVLQSFLGMCHLMGTNTFFGIEENGANQVPKDYFFFFFKRKKRYFFRVSEGLNYKMAKNECM